MWEKKGLIFNTDNDREWMVSHACVPTALILPSGDIRIFFAPRNLKGQSIPTFIDVEGKDPTNVLSVHDTPILSLGAVGAFDDGGIMPCSVVECGDEIYLYYVGWNPSVSVPYRNAIGLAVSRDVGTTFERMFPGAIVDRNKLEPYFTASPCVFRDGDKWHMWYASCTGFVKVRGRQEPIYVIKYGSSRNGIDWDRDDHTCIEPKHDMEANARPTVIRESGIYKMWFCYRGSLDYRDGTDSYRIGYAESDDARNWKRKDERSGIDVSPRGWDSKMLAYPCVIRYEDKKYLFYNGNGFGETGIGYAVWHE